MLAGNAPASAFTASDADTIYTAYNAAFYATNSNGNCYYKNDTTGGQTWIWAQAEEIEAMLDYYDRTKSPAVKTQINQICNGFIDNNGSSWTWDTYNDDITWSVIAFSRAYLATGNTTFRNVAKSNFDAMYARAWDTNFAGGGLWWSTDNGWKAGCINGPGAVAACYLYSIYGDRSYLNKAQAIYAWERQWLFHTDSGAIYDGIGTDYSYGTWVSTYNQGTFVGAGNFLYRITGLPFYYQDAILATRCTQNTLCSSDGIFPEYGSGDYGGFNGIGARWMGRLTKDQNLWMAFGPWLSTNGNAAWGVRNTNNLSWEKWKTATPAGTNVLLSWDCSDSVVIMQVGLTNVSDALQISPSAGFTAVAQYSLSPNSASINLVLTNTGATAFNWSLANTSIWLNASPSSGTLSAAGGVNVSVSLISSATTNLPAGRYYPSVWLTNLASGVAQSRSFELVISGGNAPITMTGFNAGVLAPNTATAGMPSATGFDIPGNYCFYQAGLNSGTRGLPPDGVFTSQADTLTVFQFMPYGSTNTMLLGDTYPNSGTLAFTTPLAYNFITVLACSANASASGTLGTLVLNFTNGTHSQTFNFNAQDWFNTTTNVAIQGFGRIGSGNFSIQDNGAANPNMYQTTLNLAALGLNQAVSSITFTKPANAAGNQSTGIFAVSGTIMPAPANIVQQPQSVTNNQPSVGATFSVVASGVSPLACQWYYSATGNSGTYAPLAAQTNASLTLNPTLQTNNAGSFFVVITNVYGAVTSSVVTLTVYRAPVITQQPAPTNLCRFTGTTNIWSVTANAALPVNYYWQMNGTAIPSATNFTCQLVNLQTTNSGNYTVIISNAFGAVTSSIVSLAVVPAPTYPFGQMVLTNGALGYWRLNEINGTVAHDYVAGNNGTYTATVLQDQPGDNLLDTHTAARFGYLAASNSCVTNIAMDFATSGNAVFSVEAWVNGGTQTTDAGLVTKGYGGGEEQFNLDCGGSSHAFRFFVRDASGGTHLATSSVVPNNQWHHLVGVCDEINGYVYLYVDGTNSAQATVGSYAGILNSATPVSIGSRQSGTGTAYNNQFAGFMEEVAIYGYALSSNQVQAHFLAVTNRVPAFLSNPFTVASTTAGQLYSATLATNASDPNGDSLTFAKISGPAWLSVAGGGSLNGTSLSTNVGTNSFVVSVTDPSGLSNTATMNLTVLAAAPIVTSTAWQGNNLKLNWAGGITPYQVQVTTNLINPTWQNLGSTINSNSLLVSPTNGAVFYRIYGQ
jgi:predicted alpha-1,6-mannanase (GH76 family)